MLYDRRHHVDVTLQGNLLISVIPPTPHRANMGLIYYLFTDRCVRLFQPLAFIDPKAKGMGASGNLDIEGSNVAIPEGQHPNVMCCSCHVSFNHLCFVSKRNLNASKKKKTAPDKFSEPDKNSARETSFQQLWDPEIVLLALMNIEEEDDREDDILMDLEPPRQFRPRPLSNRFGIYCTRNITMHQRAGHLDTKR